MMAGQEEFHHETSASFLAKYLDFESNIGLLLENNWELVLELGKMCQMKQWGVYYVVLAIDFYIPGKTVYWERTISRKKGKFAHKVTKMLNVKCWEEGILFYIDVAGFLHKNNPHDQAQFHDMVIKKWRLTPSQDLMRAREEE